jgi:hypothetical protein
MTHRTASLATITGLDRQAGANASARAHGDGQSVRVARTLVREGQCRTLGAREVGLTSVPVTQLMRGDLRDIWIRTTKLGRDTSCQ